MIFHSYVSLPEGIEGYNQIQRKKSCPPWLSIRGWEIPNSTEGRTKNLRIAKGCWLDSCSIDLASFPPRPDGWWSPHRFQDIPTGSWPPDISCRDSSAEQISGGLGWAKLLLWPKEIGCLRPNMNRTYGLRSLTQKQRTTTGWNILTQFAPVPKQIGAPEFIDHTLILLRQFSGRTSNSVTQDKNPNREQWWCGPLHWILEALHVCKRTVDDANALTCANVKRLGAKFSCCFFCMFFFGRPGSLPWFLQLKFLTCCIL